MFGILAGLLRRLLGGWHSTIPVLKERGFQVFLCVLLYFPILLFNDYGTYLQEHLNRWIFASLACACVIFEIIVGHYYYFKCGTEDDKYIDEQEAKGRKPAMNWIVSPVNKLLGFKPRSKQYCFVGMFLRYFICSLPASLFVGWQFAICGFVVPFIYNAMFWVDLPKTKLSSGPTGYAEFFTGLIIGWALL